jgi:glycine betaine/choline ABC-type transport system substrate-binding protein
MRGVEPQDDLRRAPQSPQLACRFRQDFMSRADGYPGFSKSVRIEVRRSARDGPVVDLHRALVAQVDLIAGNSTEGRIATLDLFQLADDRHYFPPYEAVYLVRQDS